MTKTLLAAVAALGMTQMAQADDKKFDGFYLGAEVGYQDFSRITNAGEDNFDYDGFIGYRVQMDNNWVIGLEGGSGIDATLGYAMGPNKDFLAFGFAGYSNIKLSDTQTTTTFDGIRFGGGVEYAVSKNISLRLTGTHTDYEGNINGTRAMAGVLFRF